MPTSPPPAVHMPGLPRRSPVFPPPVDADDRFAPARAVAWLRLLKLLLSILLVALAILETLRRLGLL